MSLGFKRTIIGSIYRSLGTPRENFITDLEKFCPLSKLMRNKNMFVAEDFGITLLKLGNN